MIMTYCALLALAVLRDDYAALDRPALARMVGACQSADGGCVLRLTCVSFTSLLCIKDSRRLPGRAIPICA